MPSWKDGETISDSGSLVSGWSEGQDISPRPQVPESILDPLYSGSGGVQMRCKHNKIMHKYVAFEGADTGRKFLGYGCKEEGLCDTLHVVDNEWPDTMKHALLKLWAMYEDEKDTRISGNVEYSTANYQLVLEKRDLEEEIEKLVKELSLTKPLTEKLAITSQQLELEKSKKEKAEALVDALKAEKKQWEYRVGSTFRALCSEREKVKKLSEKLEKISELCGED